MQSGIADRMNVTDERKDPGANSIPILDIECVESWLRDEVNWPEGVSMRGVRLSRLWPDKHGSITFELAVDVRVRGERTSHMIQGGRLGQVKSPTRQDVAMPSRQWAHRRDARATMPTGIGSKCTPPSREAVLDSGWLMNLSLSSAELGINLLSPDRDPRLSVATNGLDVGTLSELLRGTRTERFLGLKDGSHHLRRQIVAYRIAKRCVLRLNNPTLSGKPSAFLKGFRRMPTEELLQTYRRLGSCLQARSAGRFRLPAILDHLPDARVLILAGVVQSARHLTRTEDDLRIAASGLALLHAIPMTCSRFHSPRDEIDIARRWLPILKHFDQTHYECLLALVKRLAQLTREMPSGACCLVHRDFYAAQVLRQDEKTWFVDLDTMSMGHPEVDIATFSAHLLLDEIIGGSTDEHAVSAARFFAESYRTHGGQLSPRRFRFYVSSRDYAVGGDTRDARFGSQKRGSVVATGEPGFVLVGVMEKSGR